MALLASGHRRRLRTILAAAGLALVLGTLAAMIVRTQEGSRGHVEQNFRLRATASASLVATYLEQQAEREQQTAEQFLSTPTVPSQRFAIVAAAFGSHAAVLLDSAGRLLDVVPRDPMLVGRQVAGGYPHLRAAERGQKTVSGVVYSAARRESVTAIAVPFQSVLGGRRVFSAAYSTGGPELEAFVARTIAFPQHDVVLVDNRDHLLAASPTTRAVTLAQASPALASAVAHGSFGSVPGPGVARTFTSTAVPGTSWRLVLEVPDSKLFASIGGFAEVVPWIVFALVSVLGLLLLGLFARSLADRTRLTLLSGELESVARTDPLTGLLNRRGIDEDLARAFARSRRRTEPMTALMIDLDGFKGVNDRHGHGAGDRVLIAVADCLRETLRLEDVYGRLGGDEFVVVMAGADEAAGRAAAGRLQTAAGAVDLEDLGLPGGIPMSVGLACGVHISPVDLMRAADAELYRVKAARRAATRSAAAAAGG